jgi:ATP-dependent DNA helicase RecQ
MMRGYAELQDCRRQYLLNYFGESLDEPCGFCDNCKAGRILESNSNLSFSINSTIIHTNFGTRRVLYYEGDKIVILFETVGYKTFALELVQGLLKQLENDE